MPKQNDMLPLLAQAADPDPISKAVKAFRVRQPIGEVFIAVMDYKLVQQITYFDVRRVLRDTRDIEAYLGIQRPLNEKRVTELEHYVRFVDATFPTAIILAIDDSDYVRFDEDQNQLTLSNFKQGNARPDIAISSLCRVIDGQHRIAGLRAFKGDNFDVMVAIFVGIDISDQSYIFATVNLEQTKVNKSLVFDLFDLAKTRSPYKTCHNVAVALDTVKESPFFKRIKRLGTATEDRDFETLTQATFVSGIISYISGNPKLDRDLMLRGKHIPKEDGDTLRRLVFRNLFIEGNDVLIGRIIQSYFEAVKQRWPKAWDERGEGYMLNRTNGYRALMSVFRRVYLEVAAPGDYVDPKTFLEIFKRSDLKDTDFTTATFVPGTSGETNLRERLRKDLSADPFKRLV
ncbi:MAG TPA: DGQHR domain-containing protein [Rhizomicrobium sp.]|jgi:DGQHR domain-containing protein|nr:DGQHR domain-containing protein [Rhizomicrobium sp.]